MKFFGFVCVVAAMVILVFGNELRRTIDVGRWVLAIAGALLLGWAGLTVFGGIGTFNGELGMLIGGVLGFLLGFANILSNLLRRLWEFILRQWHRIPWWGRLLIVLAATALFVLIFLSI